MSVKMVWPFAEDAIQGAATSTHLRINGTEGV